MKSAPHPAFTDPVPAAGRAVAELRSLGVGPGSLDDLTRSHGWPQQSLLRLVSCQDAELVLRARIAGSLVLLAEAIGNTVELYRHAGTTMDLLERAKSQTGVEVR